MGPGVEPTGLSMIMIVAAVALLTLAAIVGFFVLRKRERPPASQSEGPVEADTDARRAP